MRLIDADRFLSQIEDKYMEHDITREKYMDLEDRIAQQPTIEERKKGKWIKEYWNGEHTRKCSACNITQTVTTYKGKVNFNFCPYCGAAMRGEENRMSDLIRREDATEVIYRALRTPTPDYRKDPFHDSMSLAVSMGREIPSAQSEIIHCCDCIYYDPEHIEKNGVRYEYKDMPKAAFDSLGTGLVKSEYGINFGGRCCRDYNVGYSEDKRVFVSKQNYCGRAMRRQDE